MGVALLAAACFMAMSQLGWFPSGGTALGLPLLSLVLAVIVNFVLMKSLPLGALRWMVVAVVMAQAENERYADRERVLMFPIDHGAGAHS